MRRQGSMYSDEELHEMFKTRDMVQRQLKLSLARKLEVPTVTLPPIDPSVLSELDALLWRDIQYFACEGFGQISIAEKSFERLQQKTLFIDTVDTFFEELSAQQS
jgi:hypothetical protein